MNRVSLSLHRNSVNRFGHMKYEVCTEDDGFISAIRRCMLVYSSLVETAHAQHSDPESAVYTGCIGGLWMDSAVNSQHCELAGLETHSTVNWQVIACELMAPKCCEFTVLLTTLWTCSTVNNNTVNSQHIVNYRTVNSKQWTPSTVNSQHSEFIALQTHNTMDWQDCGSH